MSLFEIILKQMRQRALSTWMTMLSVMLGTALAVAILIFQREGGGLFRQTDFGYDLIIGPKGNKLQLVLNTAYHLAEAQGTIPYHFYEEFPRNLPEQFHGVVAWKVPVAVGDNYEGYRIVGTSPAMLGVDDAGQTLPADSRPQYRVDRSFELAEGRVFHPRRFEAVIGHEVARRTALRIGSMFKGTHGTAEPAAHREEHEETWQVVGILKPTYTANDRVIFVPLEPFLSIPDHAQGLKDIAELSEGRGQHNHQEHPADPHGQKNVSTAPHQHAEHDHAKHEHAAYTKNPDGTITCNRPRSEWRISAMLVRLKTSPMGVIWAVNNGPVAMAVSPGTEMRAFFNTFLKGSSDMVLMVSVLVTVVAAVSIMVSIYNSIAARRREIAILRALGATRTRIVTMVCLEAALVGAAGALAGWIAGHALGAGASAYLKYVLGEGIPWLAVGPGEILYLVGVVALALLAGLVPAMKAYATPVAVHLAAG